MVRTMPSPSCCATSSIRPVAVVLGLERVVDLRQMAASELTSTTAPMTWTILPAAVGCRALAIVAILVMFDSSERLGAAR